MRLKNALINNGHYDRKYQYSVILMFVCNSRKSGASINVLPVAYVFGHRLWYVYIAIPKYIVGQFLNIQNVGHVNITDSLQWSSLR